MTSDIREWGFERLICAALTPAACDPAHAGATREQPASAGPPVDRTCARRRRLPEEAGEQPVRYNGAEKLAHGRRACGPERGDGIS